MAPEQEGQSGSATPAAGSREVVSYNAGSLTDALNSPIGPGFSTATGYGFKHVAGGSVALANQIRSGAITPDVYMSADAEVMYTLIGAANGDRVRWFLTMAGQKLVIAYSPSSRFKAELEAVATGDKDWTDVIRQPGFVLRRGDPRGDPGGYRCVFALRLAELCYHLPGFADAVMQGDDNPAQIGGRFPNDLQTGAADAYLMYLTSALQFGLPYIELADEVNQGNPALAAFYAQVSYTNPAGLTFHGTPALYGVTIPAAANNVPGALAFVRYLLDDPGQLPARRSWAECARLQGLSAGAGARGRRPIVYPGRSPGSRPGNLSSITSSKPCCCQTLRARCMPCRGRYWRRRRSPQSGGHSCLPQRSPLSRRRASPCRPITRSMNWTRNASRHIGCPRSRPQS
jgi:molybdate/tungstate transport system substrate-binding protein